MGANSHSPSAKDPQATSKRVATHWSTKSGTTKEWKAIGGRVVDKRQMTGSIRVTYELKGIQKGDFKDIQTGETTLTITPKDGVGEVITFKKGTISLSPIFTDDGGYGTRVTYNAIAGDDGVLFTVSEAGVGA